MARRILNRRDLRAANDAAERREAEAEEEEDREDEDEDEESDADAEDEGETEADAEVGDDDEEEVKPKKKPKKKAAVKAPAKRKARGSKSVRMKVVWGVFNNSNARIQTFEYSKKADAEALAAKLQAEKKSTHFVNPVKEPMEEKKED